MVAGGYCDLASQAKSSKYSRRNHGDTVDDSVDKWLRTLAPECSS